jgi:hypothetical protein
MDEDAATFAARLKHRAHTYGFLTCLLLVASSIIGDAGGKLFSWLWPLIASHEDETAGCRAADDLLERMHLRKCPKVTRPLHARMAGTNRRLTRLHLAFATFLALFAAVTAYGLWTAKSPSGGTK